MANSAKSEMVPKSMQEKCDRITAITDQFAKEHLNEDYAKLMRQATAALCRKRPSPVASGKEKTWACGIAHAIAMINRLFDPDQTLHMSARELCEWFEVGVSTGQSKSKQIREMLDMHQTALEWSLPNQTDKNSSIWQVPVNGMILDARTAPRDVQEALVSMGLIPHIPGEAPDQPPSVDSEDVSAVTPKASKKNAAPSPDAVYVLEVNLVDGPMTDDFIDDNPQVSRTIEIKGSQTLKGLHQAIFKALDREEEHMYEFQVGGRGPNDPKARRYGLKEAFSMPGKPPAGDVAKTSINDLGLAVGEVFGYWFDFGDDWWHVVSVMEIKEKAGKGKYPKVTHQIGASPPQYADFDEFG
ncbi:MAG TPA: plasmid pRiA4b ORF-3 family protein [Leptolyngbyaceae cyanobacterium]